MRLGDTPVPIPNTKVKTWTADGNILETVWESRWLPDFYGGIAQLGEHLPCKQGVKGSNPFISTRMPQSPVRDGHPNMYLENRIWKDKTSKTNSILTIFYDKISGSMVRKKRPWDANFNKPARHARRGWNLERGTGDG